MDNGLTGAMTAISPPTPAAATATATAARRPKSAGAFPSAARKLLVPSSAAASATACLGDTASASSPICTRCQPRLLSRRTHTAKAAASSSSWTQQTQENAASAAMVASAPTSRPRTASTRITRQIMKEEIELQRRVTQDAQRQLLKLERELSSREREIQLLQQQLAALNNRQRISRLQTAASADSPTADSNQSTDQCKLASDKGTAKPSTRTQRQLLSTLREQLANQDAYKKRLRHMLDRLTRDEQLMAANEELLRQQTASAARERTLFSGKLAQDRNVCHELETQRARILQHRQAFQRESERLLETYRMEIAARSKVGTQRQIADHRRRNLLQLMASRSSTNELLGSPTSAASDDRVGISPAEAVLRRSQIGGLNQRHVVATNAVSRTQRRSSYAVVAADAASHRESVFELYEAQYDRILAETGESDAIRVLETFLAFASNKKRLVEIEQELVMESERLEQELQAHTVLLGHLRSSGIAEVEKRKKIRDYLEEVMHERQVEKARAKESFGEHAKLFLYIQQGILNVADLLHCLNDRSAVSTVSTAAPPISCPLFASSTAIVGATSVPVVAGASSVSDASTTLSLLLHHTLLALRGQPSMAAVEFSTEQVDQLVRFLPELQIDRLVNAMGVPTKPLEALETDNLPEIDGLRTLAQATEPAQVDQEELLEQADVHLARHEIKEHEEKTLKEVEVLFRTIDAHKQRHAASTTLPGASTPSENKQRHWLLASASDSTPIDAPRHLPIQSYELSPAAVQRALTCPESEEAMREKMEAAHAFFREKRKLQQAQRGHNTANSVRARATTVASESRSSEPRQPSRPHAHADKPKASEAVRFKLLRSKEDTITPPTDASGSSNGDSSSTQHIGDQTSIGMLLSGSSEQSQSSSQTGRRSSTGGSKTARSSRSLSANEDVKRKGSAHTARDPSAVR